MRPLRVLTVGHSYVVELNRSIMGRLAQHPEIELTVAAPRFFHGDLRPIHLEPPRETPAYELVGLSARLTRHVHLFYYRDLQKLMTPGQFDLVHIWEEPYIFAGYQIAKTARKAGIPYSFWTAQNLNKSYPSPFARFERYCIRNARGWLACGELVRREMRARGYPETNSEIIGLAVNEDRFRPNPEAGRIQRERLGLHGPVLGYLGRLTEEKGMDVLMASLERVPAPWNLLVIGGGSYEAKLRRWAQNRGWADRLVIARCKHDEIPNYIQAMDILLAPSQTRPKWREQFGRMIVEAFACRVAVIGSDSGEIPYVIGSAGLVVPEADINAWAEAITGLLRDSDRRDSLAEAGLQRATEKFSSVNLAQRYLEFFQKIACHPEARLPAPSDC